MAEEREEEEHEDYVDLLVEHGFVVLQEFVNPHSKVFESLTQESISLRNSDIDLAEGYGCVIEATRLLEHADARKCIVDGISYANLRQKYHRVPPGTHSRVITDFIFGESLRPLLESIFGETYFFYNEQYIIKPPGKGNKTAFGLHRDSDNAKTTSSFVSMWIALDDVNLENGGLTFVDYSGTEVPLSLKKGSAIVFSHDVLHYSAPNISPNWRSAFMLQFSQVPMVNQNEELIGFAVPLGRESILS